MQRKQVAVDLSGSEGRQRLAGLGGRHALRRPGRVEKAISRIWPIGLTGWVGYPGSGKTYLMTRYALGQMRRGRKVFANYGIKGANLIHVDQLRGATMESIQLPRGSLVCIDEAHVWFNSRQSMKMKPEDFLVFFQGRKAGFELVWASQRLGAVDVNIRELTGTVWCCTWLPHPFHVRQPLIFQAHGFQRHLLEDVWEPVGSKFVWPRKQIYDAYSTEATVGVRVIGAKPPAVLVPPAAGALSDGQE